MSQASQARVELQLSLPSSAVVSIPQVRLLVDLESSRSLHSEIEVALELASRWLFRGGFSIDPAGSSVLLYRLGICAAPGALWTLRVRDARGRYLLRDADTLEAPKSWLVGSCPLGGDREQPIPGWRGLHLVGRSPQPARSPGSTSPTFDRS